MAILLVGPPNCGKSTLFNALTGMRQNIGNYPGVTVEKKVGIALDSHGNKVEIVDLPGVYSLAAKSIDEEVTRDAVAGNQPGIDSIDGVMLIVNMAHLDSQMGLVLQVCELGLPMVLILNMVDLAAKNGVLIKKEELARRLGGIEIIQTQAINRTGLVEVRRALSKMQASTNPRIWRGDEFFEEKMSKIESILTGKNGGQELLILSMNAGKEAAWIDPQKMREIRAIEQEYSEATGENFRAEILRKRFDAAVKLSQSIVGRIIDPWSKLTISDKIDKVLIHPVFGWVFFVGLMFLFFWGLFTLAPIPADYLDEQIGHFAGWIAEIMPEGMLRDLLSEGMIPGVAGVLVFLPQILMLFFVMGVLETTGYMSRAALLMDRPMRLAGLPGRAFIPMLSGYACAIPGMMAARTIPDARDRILTLMILPWMSCSARLPVYAVMIGVLFHSIGISPVYQALAMCGLYFMGTFTALLTARFLRKIWVKSKPTPLLMELPSYQFPNWKYISQMLFERGWQFVKRAGTIILGISILLWVLSAFPKSENPAMQAENSYLGQIGKVVEPAFAPLGFDWRVSTGVLASFAAREVFNTHMAILFHVDEDATEDEELLSQNFASAKRNDGSLLFTPDVSLAVLVFYVFALQCFPTVIVARREMASWKLAIYQLVGMGLFAWGAAWIAREITLLFLN